MSWLDEAKARCEAATRGPWEWWTSCSWRRLGVKDSYGEHVLQPTVDRHDGHPDLIVSEMDRDFIAHARTDLPRALDLIERMAACMRATRECEWPDSYYEPAPDDFGGPASLAEQFDALLKEVAGE